MSLSRIVIFIIGLIFAIVGLTVVLNNVTSHDWIALVIGGILLVVGVVLLSGKQLSI